VQARAASPFSITVSARCGSESQWISLSGVDPYGLTAKIAVYAARHFLFAGEMEAGVLAPSRALDSEAFLKTAQEQWKVSVHTETILEG
jgi:hypothetical protein